MGGRRNANRGDGMQPELPRGLLAEAEADFACGGHRVEHAGNDLRGTRAAHLVGGFRFEQLRVRENDSELIVEAMKEEPEVAGIFTGGSGAILSRRHHDASLRVSSPDRPGSRQSVSTKIRTDPPAVRTYSTLPLAIQL